MECRQCRVRRLPETAILPDTVGPHVDATARPIFVASGSHIAWKIGAAWQSGSARTHIASQKPPGLKCRPFTWGFSVIQNGYSQPVTDTEVGRASRVSTHWGGGGDSFVGVIDSPVYAARCNISEIAAGIAWSEEDHGKHHLVRCGCS